MRDIPGLVDVSGGGYIDDDQQYEILAIHGGLSRCRRRDRNRQHSIRHSIDRGRLQLGVEWAATEALVVREVAGLSGGFSLNRMIDRTTLGFRA